MVIYKVLDKSLEPLVKLYDLVNSTSKKRFKRTIKYRRILVIKLSSMGDLIVLLPVIRYIKSENLYSEITLLTTQRTAPSVYKDLNIFSQIFSISFEHPNAILRFFKFISCIKHYDMVINFDQYYNTSYLLACLNVNSCGFLTHHLGKSYSVQTLYGTRCNERANFMRLASACLGSTSPNIRGRYFSLPEMLRNKVSPSYASVVENITALTVRPIVCIHPGSSKSATMRRLSHSQLKFLINKLAELYKVVVCIGPDEIEIGDILRADSPNNCDIIMDFTLKDWVHFLSSYTALFIGVDSGLLHLASSVDVPTIGIYGPNLAEKWEPLTDIHFSYDGCEAPCRPCIVPVYGMIPNHCRYLDKLCIEMIDLNCILQKAQQLIKK